jgi:hypothetical protein
MKSFPLTLALVALILSLGCNRSRPVDMARVSEPRAYMRPATTQTSNSTGKFPAGSSGGVIGGIPGGIAKLQQPDKKVIHTAELSLVVDNVEEASAKIRALTLRANGEIDQARIWSLSEKTREGELHIRIPAEDLEPALKQFKAVGLRVTNEQLNATDVTRQFADNAARMHSLQAEEQQYLQILKQAKSIQDILDITEKLTDVRTQIEQLQANINLMSHDIAMSLVTIGLSQNAPVSESLGGWHPLLNARRSFKNMVENLGDWIDAIVSFAIFLPVIALWVLTIGGIVWIAWKLFRRFQRAPPTTA